MEETSAASKALTPIAKASRRLAALMNVNGARICQHRRKENAEFPPEVASDKVLGTTQMAN
ncbi:MAG: hypothetical protein FalmKO_35550 [Falsiruegeria mediterranea]